ncbi:hypothetical protein ACH5RR_037392 [Cinchona calisaya]|uniref:Uncharacterized protein n=1 Tax=Cinchona calisaya TaxID=153742 RepID=A0ABD2Y7B2_9GENT
MDPQETYRWASTSNSNVSSHEQSQVVQVPGSSLEIIVEKVEKSTNFASDTRTSNGVGEGSNTIVLVKSDGQDHNVEHQVMAITVSLSKDEGVEGQWQWPQGRKLTAEGILLKNRTPDTFLPCSNSANRIIWHWNPQGWLEPRIRFSPNSLNIDQMVESRVIGDYLAQFGEHF